MLAEMVQELPVGFDPSLLVGLAPFDDAAVYQLTDDLALVSTTDFSHRSSMIHQILVRLQRLMRVAMFLRWVDV